MLVYAVATQTAHALSKDAAAVWRRCDGDSSVEDIARRLGLEQARVEQALEELSTAELIEKPEGISRRALYKRAATLGAAAVSAPLIYSVAIPPSSAHASASTCSGTGCPGSGSVRLANGTCAVQCDPSTGQPCTAGVCIEDISGAFYCSSDTGSLDPCFPSDAECPTGEFCFSQNPVQGGRCVGAVC